MADRGFDSIFILITIGFCTQLHVVLLQNPANSDGTGYYRENDAGDFAVRMSYAQNNGQKALNVTIYYDTETESAKAFFTTQISDELLKKLSSCPTVSLNYRPCSTSKLDDKNLVCPKGKTQCELDLVHSCIDEFMIFDQPKMAKFLICNFGGGAYMECAKAIKVLEADVKNCVSQVDDVPSYGASSCASFHAIFKLTRANPDGSEKQNAAKCPDAITDFKKTLCAVLAQGPVKCDAVCK